MSTFQLSIVVSAKPRVRFLRLVLGGLGMLAPIVVGNTRAQTTPSPALFEFLPVAETRAASGPIRRRQAVFVRHELVNGAAPGMAMRFNLFRDVAFEADVEQVYTTGRGDRVLAGRLQNLPESQFVLLVHGEEIVADFTASPLEHYQLRREAAGPQEIRRVDLRGLVGCGGTDSSPLRPTEPRRRSVAPSQGADISAPASELPEDAGQFDVLIAYTPAARLQAGGVNAIEAQAAFAVERANLSYQNSGITTRARLVHTMEVAYTEVGQDLQEDLRRLETPGEGLLDEVQAARDRFQADLVSLFVTGPTPNTPGRFIVGRATFAVGTGDDGQVFGQPEGGFSIVVPSYDVATTFAHEVGHNFGCQHDRENVIVNGVNTGPGIFDFSYGWRFTVSYSYLVHDIMSYDPGMVIPYFSNPQVFYQGVPTGVPDYADNARTMNATAPFIANLRHATTVSITASVPQALENPLTPGRFTVTRTGGPTNQPLTVNYRTDGLYSIGRGNAVNAVNYQTLTGSVVIPAGQTSADIDLVPIDDNIPQGSQYASVTLVEGDGYHLSARPDANSARVIIRDTLTTVSVLASRPTVSRSQLQPGSFTFSRTGPLDAPLLVRFHVIDTMGYPPSVQDYQFSPALSPDRFDRYSVTIPTGSATVDLAIIPGPQLVTGGYQGVSVVLETQDSYQVGFPEAVVSIYDDVVSPLSMLAIRAVESIAPAVTPGGQFVVTRAGSLDQQVYFKVSFSGTAAYGGDYYQNLLTAIGYQSFGADIYLTLEPGQDVLPFRIVPGSNPDKTTKFVIATLGLNPLYPPRVLYTVDPERVSARIDLLASLP